MWIWNRQQNSWFYYDIDRIEKLTDEISIMKMISTEFWMKVFQKNISNLQTNNKGKFKLQDDGWRLLGKLVDIEDDEEDIKSSPEVDPSATPSHDPSTQLAETGATYAYKPLSSLKRQKLMRTLIVEFITGMVKGALDNLNLKSHWVGEWKDATRMLEISIEIA